MTRLVLAGGGHAHALVLRSLRHFVSKNLDVLLVNPGPKHTYSGMVPGVVAGHYALEQAQIDLGRLAREAGAVLVEDRVVRIDTTGRRLVLASGEPLSYDVLSINLGSAPKPAAGGIPVKPFEDLLARWRLLMDRGPRAPRIAVVGAGAAGVELAMAMKHALGRRAGSEVALFSERFDFAPALGARLRGMLQARAIPLRLEASPGAGFDAVFVATGPAAPQAVQGSALEKDAGGFLRVDERLQSVSHPNVFAAGDAAALPGEGAPKSGVYAVRQGPILADNLKRAVRGMTLKKYRPQPRSLVLISCGDRYAIASRGDWTAEGAWAWRWKDWIDRRWIAGFR